MMKKIFTLVLVLTMATAMNVQAQFYVMRSTTTPHRAAVQNAESATGSNWWGYTDPTASTSGLGVRASDTYHCAIYVPGDHDVAAGKTIEAVRFGLKATHVSNVKLWIANALPTTISTSTTLALVDIPNSDLSEDIEVPVPSIAIPSGGIYVGYTFTVTATTTQDDQFPILISGQDIPNGMFLRTNNNVTNWSDMYGQGYGNLYMLLKLQGTFGDNMVSPSDFGTVNVQIGENATAFVDIVNNGITPVFGIDYTITTDGTVGSPLHADLSSPLAFSRHTTVALTIPSDAAPASKQKTLTVTKVNGNDNVSAKPSATFTLNSLIEFIERKVVVEQFTGTGCGYCPRGHVGMAKMRTTFGDRFVGIALHQYSSQSSDAMYIAHNAYAPLSFDGAPSARMNRGAEIDPYYGSGNDVLDDFRSEMAIPATARVDVSGTYDVTTTHVDASVTVKSQVDANYKLEFVLVADGLTGTGTGWNQSNYYYQYSAVQLPTDLRPYANGGTYGKSTITGYIFNDVAIASSYVSGSNKVSPLTMTANEPQTVNYTLPLPTYQKLLDALKLDEVYVVALLIDDSGAIVNADKQKVSEGGSSAINTLTATGSQTTRHYSIDGRQLTQPQRGLNIIKMADGKTFKVMVK